MKFVIVLTMGVMLGCAWTAQRAGAQPAPCDTCNSSDAPPCGCAGHEGGCCCDGLCRQAPPNPLAPGRPSPPPCCADGYCYPNPATWGHYGTRWRRWPIELAAATPPGAATAPRPSPDVPTYDVPPPEEEDRRAPPPSVTRGKPVEIGPRATPPQEGAKETPPGTPPASSTPTSPTTPEEEGGTDLSPQDIFGLPPENTPRSTAPFGTPPEEAPGASPLTPPPAGETPPATPPAAAPLDAPMGDLDPPPALPLAAPKLSEQPKIRVAEPPATSSPKRDVRRGPQDDPPPAPPTAVASVWR
jgi:hypothetical protein